MAWRLLTAIFVAMLGGCASTPSASNETMMVSVKGVNYSGDVVVFSVDDPLAPKNATGGDRASSYSGAAVQCCIELPRVWHPGIQLVIDAIVYPVDETDFKREIPRYMKKFTVEVPQYPADQPTELWVIRTPSGDMNLVASNVDPSHEAWPGAIKGWPEPSLTVKKRYWERKVAEARDGIETVKAALDEGMSEPTVRQHTWDVIKNNQPREVAQFSGPNDPAFVDSVTKRRQQALKFYEANLRKLMESKP